MNLFGGVSAECHEGRANVFWVNPYRQKVIPIRVTCHRFGERESKILGFFRVCVCHSIISTPEYLDLFRSCFIKVSSIGGPLDYLNRPICQSSHSNDPYFTIESLYWDTVCSLPNVAQYEGRNSSGRIDRGIHQTLSITNH